MLNLFQHLRTPIFAENKAEDAEITLYCLAVASYLFAVKSQPCSSLYP